MNDIDHTFWYLTRASGFVAYLFLSASVVLGLSMTGTLLERWVRRYRIYDFHRFLSLITLGATVFHVLIVLPDDFIGFRLEELLVPFASPFEPLFMALGILSLYLIAFVIASFYLRHLIHYRAWRLIHYATFGGFVLALAHGVGAGTDTQAAWAQYLLRRDRPRRLQPPRLPRPQGRVARHPRARAGASDRAATALRPRPEIDRRSTAGWAQPAVDAIIRRGS